MVSPHHTVIEVYVVLAIINAFLGIGQGIYQSSFPTEAIRSPFTQFPLDDEFPVLNSTGVIANMTNPTNSTGDAIAWASDFIANFEATIDVLLEFTQFFTGGFIADLLVSLGFPDEFYAIVGVPMGLYTMYFVFVLITNRLGN